MGAPWKPYAMAGIRPAESGVGHGLILRHGSAEKRPRGSSSGFTPLQREKRAALVTTDVKKQCRQCSCRNDWLSPVPQTSGAPWKTVLLWSSSSCTGQVRPPKFLGFSSQVCAYVFREWCFTHRYVHIYMYAYLWHIRSCMIARKCMYEEQLKLLYYELPAGTAYRTRVTKLYHKKFPSPRAAEQVLLSLQ